MSGSSTSVPSSSSSSSSQPFEIAESPECGRYLLATRDIPARTVIWVEAPLVVGPKWSLEEFEKEVPIAPCVGCFRPVRIGEAQCGKCSWPACSPECAGLAAPQRHGVECQVLSNTAAPTAAQTGDLAAALDFYRSDALLALRTLMLQVKWPERWTHLLQLPSHDEARKARAQYYE